MKQSKTLTAVIPVYNSAGILEEVCREAEQVFTAAGCDWTVIMVNDGSSDGVQPVLEDICRRNSRFGWLRLGQNRGEQTAVYCGLCAVEPGRAVVIMDDDGQHDPADALRLISALDETGCLVVYAAFDRRQQTFARRLAGRLARLTGRLMGRGDKSSLNSFKALAPSCLPGLLSAAPLSFHIDRCLHQLGLKAASLPCRHRLSLRSRSSYTWRRLLAVYLRMLSGPAPGPDIRPMPATGQAAAADGRLGRAAGLVADYQLPIRHN